MMWGSIVKLLDEIVIAAIISILGFICGKTYKKIRSFFYKRAMSFSIDGLWYSRHNNFQGENIIEIIQFKQNREDVLFKLIQYKEHKKNIKRTDIHFGEEGFSLRMWFLYSIVQIVKI